MKKVLTIIVVIALVIGMIPLAAFAMEHEEEAAQPAAEQRTLTLRINDASYPYDGEPHTGGAIEVEGLMGGDTCDVSALAPQVEESEVGEYPLIISGDPVVLRDGADVTAEYNVVKVDGTLTISAPAESVPAPESQVMAASANAILGDPAPQDGAGKQVITLTANSDTKTYQYNQSKKAGVAQSVSGYTGVPEGLTITGLSAGATGTNTGEYQAEFSGQNKVVIKETATGKVVTDQYELNLVPGTLTIDPADLYVAVSFQLKDAGEPNPSNSVQFYAAVKPEKPDDGDPSRQYFSRDLPSGIRPDATAAKLGLSGSVQYATEATADSVPGHYAIEASGYSSDNFNIHYMTGYLTVLGTCDISADAYTGTYDGQYHDAFASAPEMTSCHFYAEDIKREYSIDGGKTFTDTMPQFRDAGSYDVTVKMQVDMYKSGYQYADGILWGFPTEKTFTVVIDPTDVTVTVDGGSKTYGDPDPTLTATVGGLPENESLDVTLQRALGENVDSYDVDASYTDNPNYSVTVVPGTLDILPKDVTLTVDDKAKEAGQDDPTFTASVSGLVGSDTLSYTLERALGEEAGEYKISAILGSNPNYRVTVAAGTLTIGAGSNTIVPPVTDGTITPPGPTTPTTPPEPTVPETNVPAPEITPPAEPTVPLTLPAETTTDDTAPAPTPAAAPAAAPTTAPAAAAPAEAAPVAEAPANNGQQSIADGQTPPLAGGTQSQDIADGKVPLAGASIGASWALLNLLLMIATGIIMLALLIGYFVGKKKKGQDEESGDKQGTLKRKGLARLLSIVPAVLAIVAFFLTENMANPMVWVDKWTLLMGIIAIVQVVVAVFSKKSRKEDDTKDAHPAQA